MVEKSNSGFFFFSKVIFKWFQNEFLNVWCAYSVFEMCSALSSVFGILHNVDEVKIRIVGLNASGKTSILCRLEKMKLGEVTHDSPHDIPAVGFSHKSIHHNNTYGF